METMNFIKAINEALFEELEYDSKTFILGEDVGKKGGVFKATEGLYEKFGKERVLDSPLAESTIVGVAAGASMYGYKVIAEIQFVDFILPAMNQIISEIAKMRYRSFNDWSCPVVIRAPYGGGVHGGLYHSQSFENLFQIPGLRVVIPSSPFDAKALLKSAIRSDDPILFFEHKRAYRLLSGEVGTKNELLPLDKAIVKKEGTDITVITYGFCTSMILEIAQKLESTKNISVQILDLVSVYPLDKKAIIENAQKTGKVLLVSEGNLEGNIIGEVSAIIAENCLFDLDAPIKRIAAPDVPLMPYAHELEKELMLDSAKIEKEILELAQF